MQEPRSCIHRSYRCENGDQILHSDHFLSSHLESLFYYSMDLFNLIGNSLFEISVLIDTHPKISYESQDTRISRRNLMALGVHQDKKVDFLRSDLIMS